MSRQNGPDYIIIPPEVSLERLINTKDLQSSRSVTDQNTNVDDSHRPWQRQFENLIVIKLDPPVFIEYFFASSPWRQIRNFDIIDSKIRCLPASPFQLYLSYGTLRGITAQCFEPCTVTSRRCPQQNLFWTAMLYAHTAHPSRKTRGPIGMVWNPGNLQAHIFKIMVM